MDRFPRFLLLLFVPVVALTLGGCSGLIKPEGKVVSNGQTYTAPKGKRVRITLHPVELAEGYQSEDDFVASVRQGDGTFYVVGRRGKGIPPGKYKLSVKLTTRTGETDLWKGKYSIDNSNFEYALGGGEEIVLELGTPPEI